MTRCARCKDEGSLTHTPDDGTIVICPSCVRDLAALALLDEDICPHRYALAADLFEWFPGLVVRKDAL
jgi:hypothetical protein